MSMIIVFAGLIVGFLVGLSGIGGGVIMTPFLILGLGISPSTAIGTDLAYAACTKVIGAWQHWKQGTVDKRLALWMATGSVPASLLGVSLVAVMRRYGGAQIDIFMGRALAIVLFIVSLLLIWQAVRKQASGDANKTLALKRSRKLAVVVGVLGGTAVGLTSIGSGAIITALLVYFYRKEAAEIVGTDIFHAALLTSAAALAHTVAGDVDFLLAGQLLLGSVPGVILGSHLTVKIPERVLRSGLGVLLMGSAIKLL